MGGDLTIYEHIYTHYVYCGWIGETSFSPVLVIDLCCFHVSLKTDVDEHPLLPSDAEVAREGLVEG